MSDTSYTFSGTTHQSPFEIVNDPSKPGWDDVSLISDQDRDDENDDEEEEYRLFGTSIRSVIDLFRKQ